MDLDDSPEETDARRHVGQEAVQRRGGMGMTGEIELARAVGDAGRHLERCAAAS